MKPLYKINQTVNFIFDGSKKIGKIIGVIEIVGIKSTYNIECDGYYKGISEKDVCGIYTEKKSNESKYLVGDVVKFKTITQKVLIGKIYRNSGLDYYINVNELHRVYNFYAHISNIIGLVKNTEINDLRKIIEEKKLKYSIGDIVRYKTTTNGEQIGRIYDIKFYDQDYYQIKTDNKWWSSNYENIIGLVKNTEVNDLRKIIEEKDKSIFQLQSDIKRLENRCVRLDNAADEAVENAVLIDVQYDKLYGEHQELKKELEEYKKIEKDGWQNI